MMLPYQNTQELLEDATHQELYKKLVAQINKDFQLANLDYEFREDISAADLKNQLCEVIFVLINEKFADYLNLLYIMDVSEAKIKELDGRDLVRMTENVVFLLLKREYQKVWYKNLYNY